MLMATANQNHSRLASSLANHLSSVWHQHPGFSGDVHLADASAGTWVRTAACPAPRLWVFLSGHYRTFSWTRATLAVVFHTFDGAK